MSISSPQPLALEESTTVDRYSEGPAPTITHDGTTGRVLGVKHSPGNSGFCSVFCVDPAQLSVLPVLTPK